VLHYIPRELEYLLKPVNALEEDLPILNYNLELRCEFTFANLEFSFIAICYVRTSFRFFRGNVVNLCMYVFDFMLQNSWVVVTDRVNNLSPLFNDVRMRRITHLKECMLLCHEYAIVAIQERSYEV
jgi:hypothetical protein